MPEGPVSISITLKQTVLLTLVYQNRETSVNGIFACGNVLQVHDLVDFVSEEGELAGRSACEYLQKGEIAKDTISVINGKNINYVVPQLIDKNADGNVKLYFRVSNTFKDCTIKVTCGDKEILSKKKMVAVPGEMETIILTKDKISSLDQDLTVWLEEGGK